MSLAATIEALTGRFGPAAIVVLAGLAIIFDALLRTRGRDR